MTGRADKDVVVAALAEVGHIAHISGPHTALIDLSLDPRIAWRAWNLGAAAKGNPPLSFDEWVNYELTFGEPEHIASRRMWFTHHGIEAAS